MERYLSPGNCSSRPVIDRARGLSVLHDVAKSLAPLIEALGADAQAHLVGGVVRDALLGLPVKDLDMAVALHPQVVVERLTRARIRVVETGLRHGTVSAILESGNLEITTFRRPAAEGHDSFSTTIEEDLQYRDFTINALAFYPPSDAIIDPWNGLADLESGIVRGVDDPLARFQEDPLRILRMIRFGAAAGRTMEKITFSAAKECVPQLVRISVERIRSELEQILVSNYPRPALYALLDLGIIAMILPELLPSVGFEQNRFHTKDVFEHTVDVVERAAPERIVRLAALFHDIAKPASLTVDDDGERHFYRHEDIGAQMTQEILERLRFGSADSASVVSLVRHHMRPLNCGPAGARRIMRDLGDDFERWKLLKCADSPPIMAEQEFQSCFDTFVALAAAEKERLGPGLFQLTIGGQELLDLGMHEGPQIGEILRALHELVVEDPTKNTPELLIEEAKRMLTKT